jgi:hypothetical protein
MATVVGAHGVTISTDGVQTGAFLTQINNELAASTVAGATVVSIGWDGTGSFPTVPAGDVGIVFYSGTATSVAVPAGFKGTFIAPGNVSVTGGNADVEIVLGSGTVAGTAVGAGSYSGGAGTVLGVDGTNSINDTATGAVVAVADGSTATVTGTDATVQVDGNGNTVSATGAGDVVIVGGDQGSVTGGSSALVDAASVAGNAVTLSGANDSVDLTTGVNTVFATGASDSALVTGGTNVLEWESVGSVTFDAGSSTLVAAANVTVYGGSGTVGAAAEVVAAGGDLYVGGSDSASSLVFVTGGKNTIIGGAEADTVYAVAGQKFVGGSGDLWFAGLAGTSTVVGGSGAETLYSAGTGSNVFYGGSGTLWYAGFNDSETSTVFGGSGNESLFGVGANSDFVGGTGSVTAWLYGGSDTFVGGQGPYIYSVANGSASVQNLSLVGTGAATVNNYNVGSETINAAATAGKDTFYQGALAGSATISASSAGQDTVWLVDPAAAARTIAVTNWQSSDSVGLFGYSSTDQSALSTAISTGAASVTLSDNTTIQFVTKTV